MKALEEDKYVRQIEGYLPYAKVAFIDEIFKANSAILNTLLTILNERLFDNGSARTRVPLICLVSTLAFGLLVCGHALIAGSQTSPEGPHVGWPASAFCAGLVSQS